MNHESRSSKITESGSFFRHCIVIYHCTQLSNDYFWLGASICTRVRPDAPIFAPTLLPFADILSFCATMPYVKKKQNPQSPL